MKMVAYPENGVILVSRSVSFVISEKCVLGPHDAQSVIQGRNPRLSVDGLLKIVRVNWCPKNLYISKKYMRCLGKTQRKYLYL